MNGNEDLIQAMERFRDRHNLGDSAAAKLLSGTPNMLIRLRAGNTVWKKTEDKIRALIVHYDNIAEEARRGK